MATIKFDNTDILTTTNIVRYVKHESDPSRDLNTLQLTREDGEVLISERYNTKTISIKGILTAASQAALESAIDTMKELFSRIEKNLDVDWNSSTRRYVATCVDVKFDRDHFNLLFVPWEAEFLALKGTGEDTSETTVLNEHTITVTNPVADSFVLAGSAPPKPIITLKGANWSSVVKGVEYKNTDTGEKIVITRNKNWSGDYSVIINCALKKVTDNIAAVLYNEGIFYGIFPNFIIGTNNILVTAGGIVNQETSENGDFTYVGSGNNVETTNIRLAQSFSVPYADDTFKGVTMILSKTLTPGTITWRIETDDDGKPSGSLADANATGTIAVGDVSTSTGYVTDYSANLWTLEANVKYWLVISAAGVDGSNYYTWWQAPSVATLYKKYSRGNLLTSTDAGANWNVDGTDPLASFGFKIRYGGEPGVCDAKHSVKYTKRYL